jgi:acetyl-CoA carboxylase biotin carboxyl carrier protein
MNIKEIKELVELVARRGLAGLEVEQAGFRLRIEGPRQEHGRVVSHTAAAHPVELVDAVPMALPASLAPAPQAPIAAGPARPAPVEDGLHVVTSPIVGTFYRASKPDAEPFVKTGGAVEKGQTLCIIEAMKLMNEIEADVAGTVVEIFPQNGQPVEYGERLFSIRLR